MSINVGKILQLVFFYFNFKTEESLLSALSFFGKNIYNTIHSLIMYNKFVYNPRRSLSNTHMNKNKFYLQYQQYIFMYLYKQSMYINTSTLMFIKIYRNAFVNLFTRCKHFAYECFIYNCICNIILNLILVYVYLFTFDLQRKIKSTCLF